VWLLTIQSGEFIGFVGWWIGKKTIGVKVVVVRRKIRIQSDAPKIKADRQKDRGSKIRPARKNGGKSGGYPERGISG